MLPLRWLSYGYRSALLQGYVLFGPTRPCLPSGEYVQSLLLAQSGRTTDARSMREAALQRPIGSEGETIAEAMTRRAARLRQ